VIDLHAHMIPGLDDGVATIEEASGVARAALADGVRTIAATPHVREDYPTTPEQMETGVEQVRRAFAAAGIAVEIVHGGEIELARLGRMDVEELRRFSLGQRGRHVLIECPNRGWPPALDSIAGYLRQFGLVPILTHPERNAAIQDRPRLLERMVAEGALVQLTARSFAPAGNAAARSTAFRLLDLELAHLIGSDTHGWGSPTLRAAAEAIGDSELVRRLVVEVPAEILAAEPAP
jgi:protein-tyrosine phosphatase